MSFLIRILVCLALRLRDGQSASEYSGASALSLTLLSKAYETRSLPRLFMMALTIRCPEDMLIRCEDSRSNFRVSWPN